MSATADTASNTADTILDTLKSMPRGEVDDVRKRINAYLALGVWEGGEASGDDDPTGRTSDALRVYRILIDEMQAAGLADRRATSYDRLKNRRDFATKAEWLCRFLREQAPERRVQDAIMRIGIQLLLRQMQRYAIDTGKFTLTPHVLARNIARVPAQLDREFPGYGACGMLHLLIKG